MCVQVSSPPLPLIFTCPSLVPPALISQQLILNMLMCPQRKDSFANEKFQATKNRNVLPYHHSFKNKKIMSAMCAIA